MQSHSSQSPPRVVVASVWHETNTFARGETGLDDFAAFRLARDEEAVLAAYDGTRTEIGGALDHCRANGVEARAVYAAAALPSATVSAAAYREIRDGVLEAIAGALPADGVVLALHGAMVADGEPDPDSALVRSTRELIGDTGLAVSLDLHANPGEELLRHADAVVAYDTYPHVDPFERGAEAVGLALSARARCLTVAWRRLPLLTCPAAQATADRPMAEIVAAAHALERRPGIAAVAVAPGYPYADVERLGFTVAVTATEAGAAQECADELAGLVWRRRHEFDRKLLTPGEALDEALAASACPVVLADASDNVGGGAPGDGTALLAALLERRVAGAVVVLWDPEAAAAAAAAGEGADVQLAVGGKTDDRHGEPVLLRGRVALVRSPSYRRTGSYMTGQVVDMGLTAVVEAGGSEVVLTSRRVMPFDADHLEAVSIDPSRRRILVVKSALAWRAAFGDLARSALYVDGPGICTCRLGELPYVRLPRPIVPLDGEPADPFRSRPVPRPG